MAGKYIIVAGGVYSGTGKGVSVASIALLLKLRGHSVSIIKFDPYLNVNAGILAPSQHGECFLCDDGTETDLDLGHYERIAGVTMSQKNICTSGVLLEELITQQKNGSYLGQTVQIIPHQTNLIQNRLMQLAKESDVVIAEIGGTVGDMESAPFYEAVRQFKQQKNGDVMIAMVAPILWVDTIKEYKSKPLQNAVRELNRNGLQPDMLLCRVPRRVGTSELPEGYLDKISSLTGVPRDGIFDAPDVDCIYKVPLEFYSRHVDDLCVDLLHLKRGACRIHKHRELLERPLDSQVEIGIIGKYTNCDEAYISLKEALFHAGCSVGGKVNIRWIKADDLENKDEATVAKAFEGLSGAIIPGGFDKRGVEGKIRAIRYCRENKIPFLGICLGLQCAVIEYARNVLGLSANSQEFEPSCVDPVVHYVEGQKNIENKSGTMRLGAYDCELAKGSMVLDLYGGKKMVSERHRHRLEVNQKYVNSFASRGFRVVGTNPQSGLVEMMELDRELHPYFVGTQAHPEFKSKLSEPHPLFRGLVSAAIDFSKRTGGKGE